ncbi:hypothetical protein [Pontibacter pudoricolor]|uniref:hypothetical protein n=1 Tax=Pontibacter pudoricolor TaxID=2694930 RepID=UPI001390EE43|nr:hypothetical protein [Pontibacter pudoricolor]
MTPKEEYLLHTWPKQQAKGKTTYMASHALIYGLLVGFFSLMFRYGDAPVMEMVLSLEFLAKLVLFVVIGLIMANYKWKANNRKYDKLKHQSEQQPASQL